jgi:branched-chain amino acid transport system permease protein
MSSQWVRYEFCLATVAAAAMVVRAIRRSRSGRVMIGTRDNERAADALAVPTTRVKLETFVFSGALAGLAGALYVLALAPGGAGQGTFPPSRSIEVFSYSVIGGLGTVAGAVSGILFFHILDFVLAKQFSGDVVTILRLSLSGAGLLWILYFLPGGIWQLVQRIRDRYLRRVAAKHDLLVPSLVADKRVDDTGPEPSDDHADDETSVIAGALQ